MKQLILLCIAFLLAERINANECQTKMKDGQSILTEESGLSSSIQPLQQQLVDQKISFTNQILIIKILFQLNGQCLDKCPSEYYSDGNKVCQKCLSNCGQCQDSTSCSECLHNYSLYNDKQQCIAQCPMNFYVEQSECKPCSENKNNNQCRKCKQGKIRDGQSCVDSCATNQFILTIYKQNTCQNCQQNCLACTTYQKCSDCGTFMNQDDICLQNCTQNHYPDSNKRCQPCHKDCKTCFGPKSDECLSCEDNYKLSDSQCYKACLQNTKWNPQSLKCEDGNSESLRTIRCNQCVSGQICNKGECIDDCDSGYFMRNTDQGFVCDKCSINCSVCLSKEKCLHCNQYFQLQNGLCQQSCDKGYYPTKNQTCRKCHYSCKECDGPTPSDCLSCHSTNQLKGGKCFNSQQLTIRERIIDNLQMNSHGHGHGNGKRRRNHNHNHSFRLIIDFIVMMLFILL